MGRVALKLSLIISLLLAPALASGDSFTPVPCLDSGDRSFLQIKVVKYTGGTSASMIVEVRNGGPLAETFAAKGLYFVPADVPIEGPERPPQRVVAAGPFVNVKSKGSATQVSVAPGKTVKLELRTFCLDAHRPSPRRTQSFKVATERLPADLRGRIEQGTADILKRTKGDLRARMEIQSLVWRARGAKWIKLQGERPGESAHRSTTTPHSSHGGFYITPPSQHAR
jgi:hypothetical protein